MLLAGLLGLAATATPVEPCFGPRLRVAVPDDPATALAAYTAGYFVQEKTGVEPEFVKTSQRVLAEGKADLALAAAAIACPKGMTARPAGEVPGLGAARFWVRDEVLDDLRFTTVDRALAKLPAFYSTDAYRRALQSGVAPKKAARKAILDGT